MKIIFVTTQLFIKMKSIRGVLSRSNLLFFEYFNPKGIATHQRTRTLACNDMAEQLRIL